MPYFRDESNTCQSGKSHRKVRLHFMKNIEKAKNLKLKDLVDYQLGQVVSKNTGAKRPR